MQPSNRPQLSIIQPPDNLSELIGSDERSIYEPLPEMSAELRSVLRKTAQETRQSISRTPFVRDLEEAHGFKRIPPKDGSDMEARLDLWSSWLIRQLPEALLAPFLRCAGLTEEDVTPPPRNPRKRPRLHY